MARQTRPKSIIAGSGDASLDALQTRRAKVSVAGSGNVSLRATETVEGDLMGSGDRRCMEAPAARRKLGPSVLGGWAGR